MLRALELSLVAAVGLLCGCLPPLGEVTTSESSGDASSTTSTATASIGLDTTASASMGTSLGGSGSSSGATTSASSSGSDDESSSGEPADEPLGPFGLAQPIDELNSFANDDDPTLTGDLLEIYFASTRAGSEDVWTSTRASVADAWDAPVAVDSLSSIYTETFPEVSADGLLMLLASNRGTMIELDVYFSRRDARGQPWPEPVALAGAATAIDDYGATPSPDLTSAFLCRVVPEGLGQADIWLAPADFDAGVVGAPLLIPELSGPYADCSVSSSPSGREIFFESTRPIGAGFDWNLWMATRDDPRGPWDPPVAVTELNGEADDVDPWLSPDRHTLYFASGTPGVYGLYVATRE